MARISTLVDNRTDTAETVLAASRIHGEAIAAELADTLVVVDEAVVRTLLGSLEALLKQATEKMRADEVEYAGEKAETSQARAERDEVHDELREVYMQVRSLVQGSAGEAAVAEFGIDGELPRTLKQLVETSNNAAARIRAADDRGDGPLGVVFDADRFADALEGPMANARKWLERVQNEGREDELAMLERDRSVADWERIYRGVALVLQGFFTIVDRTDLAQRVRPTVRRAAGRDVQPDVTTEEAQPVADPA